MSRRLGVGWTALAARVLQGVFIIVMGLMGGAAGLITAFLITYTLHGFAGPVHNTLLHREAAPTNRAGCRARAAATDASSPGTLAISVARATA